VVQVQAQRLVETVVLVAVEAVLMVGELIALVVVETHHQLRQAKVIMEEVL
jgi:hypothetical protein